MTEKLTTITKTTNGLTATIVCLLLALVIGVIGVACMPETTSPLDPEHKLNARELEHAYQIWLVEQRVFQRKFELAAEDLDTQTEQLTAIGEAIQTLASGGVPSVPGLLQLLLGAGVVGLITDNVRRTKATITANKGKA